MVTILLSTLNQMEFHLVQIRKENCQNDCILFNLKGNGNLVFSVYALYSLDTSRPGKQHQSETRFSRHHGRPIESLPQTLQTITALSYWGTSGGPQLVPNYAETPVSRTVNVSFFQFWDAYTKCYKSTNFQLRMTVVYSASWILYVYILHMYIYYINPYR